MSKYDVLFFDLDGTIIDSFPAFFAMCLAVARNNGWTTTDETSELIKEEWGVRTDLFATRCWPGVDWKILQTEFNAFNKKAIDLPLFPETLETLAALRGDKYIVTGRLRNGTIPALQYHGLLDFFSRVITRTEVRHNKPDPEGLELIIQPLERKLGLPRERMLMVGDGYYSDALCAAAADIDFLAVAESSNLSRGHFIKNGVPATMIIDRFRDLPEWLSKT